ncbi:MAG: DUF4331 family protein [Kofleriaceae bacterium]
MTANVTADLNDVYTWMDAGGEKVNLAMTVSPFEDGTHDFGPSVQYVFHAQSHEGSDNPAAFAPAAATVDTKVICTFASATSGQCWVTTGGTVTDYVKGDFSSTSGVSSADGKVKVFAGHRSDPFYFNLAGFKAAVGKLETSAPVGQPTAGGCPHYMAADLLVAGMDLTNPTAACGNATDCFATLNVLAISMQIDKSLLLHGSDHLLSVWGSTHAAQ